MKYIKTFESHSWNERKSKILNDMKKYVLGSIVEEEVIYNYVQVLHNYEDFSDGNIGERIEEFTKYKLIELPIEDIDLEEFTLYDFDNLTSQYLETGWYPPIVYNLEDHTMIDGLHRANAVKEAGDTIILAWIGI